MSVIVVVCSQVSFVVWCLSLCLLVWFFSPGGEDGCWVTEADFSEGLLEYSDDEEE